MSSSDLDPSASVATAEPPQPPGAPPATGTAAPGPDRKRRRGCGCALAAAVVVVLLAAAGAGAYLWLSPQPATVSPAAETGSPAALSAFSSAMRKAGVRAPQAPAKPVELSAIKATGSHRLDATFSYDELTALLTAFSHASKSAKSAGAAVTSVEAADGDTIRVGGRMSMSGMSYTGTVEGPATFADGKIATAGKVSATMNGFPIPDSQADKAAGLLIRYLNAYIAAAPGLKIESAQANADGIHVTGTAPDAISW